jgi:uncharacterized protein
MFALADKYRNGTGGVSKDDRRAFMLYLAAAKAGHVEAMSMVGWCLDQAIGVDQDWAEAQKWYLAAAAKGNAQAAHNAAVNFENGWGGPKDTGKAVQFYKSAAGAGVKASLLGLKRLDPPAYIEAVLKSGAVEDQYALGRSLAYGVDCKRDEVRAYPLLLAAGNKGHPDAQCEVGSACMAGRGVIRNESVGLAWWTAAAKAGNSTAATLLAKYYSEKKDAAQATSYARRVRTRSPLSLSARACACPCLDA